MRVAHGSPRVRKDIDHQLVGPLGRPVGRAKPRSVPSPAIDHTYVGFEAKRGCLALSRAAPDRRRWPLVKS